MGIKSSKKYNVTTEQQGGSAAAAAGEGSSQQTKEVEPVKEASAHISEGPPTEGSVKISEGPSAKISQEQPPEESTPQETAAEGSTPQETAAEGSKVEDAGSAPTKEEDIASEDTDHVQHVLCKADDIENGEMREFEVDGRKVIVIKKDGKFHAIGSKCSHYGAPLIKGVYSHGFIRCPWHGACFNVETGDIEDFPGLDSLPKFEVNIQDDSSVKVVASRDCLIKTKRTRQMCTLNPQVKDELPVVIVGGGAAAVSCAETLRQEGYDKRVVIVSQEHALPYDRPKISKGLGVEVDNILMRPSEFYQQYGIEIQCGVATIKVDTTLKKVELSDGSEISYEKLVVATGGRPRELTCPGADLQNVTYLRTPEDCARIAELAPGKNVVVIGSSFIGMEIASVLTKQETKSITCVDILNVPFELVLGTDVGEGLKQLHESNGVKFHMGSGVKELRGADGVLSEVVLNNDTILPADLCVVGIGVVPATELLEGSGVERDDRGFVLVNENMKTNVDDVYACGDIVKFPLSSFGNEICNVQHWQMALKHGNIAGLSLSGKATPIITVPFFWSVMFGKSLRYTGYGAGYDDIIIKGDLSKLKFVAYYLKSELVVAVATLARDPVAAQIAECFRLGRKITKDEVENNENDSWESLLK